MDKTSQPEKGKVWLNCLCLIASPCILIIGWHLTMFGFFAAEIWVIISTFVVPWNYRESKNRVVKEALLCFCVGNMITFGFIWWIWSNATSFQ